MRFTTFEGLITVFNLEKDSFVVQVFAGPAQADRHSISGAIQKAASHRSAIRRAACVRDRE
jgi:hypothetical protein